MIGGGRLASFVLMIALAIASVLAWSRAARVPPRRCRERSTPAQRLRLPTRRRTVPYPVSVAEVLEAVARGLRSGASLAVALGDASAHAPGVLGEQLRSVASSIAVGQPMGEALGQWRSTVIKRHAPSVGLATAVLQLADRVGGATARALDGVAASLRDTASVQREARALAAQAGASAFVMIAAPLGYALISLASGSSAAHVMVATAAGRWCLAIGIALDVLAAAWMRSIVRNVA